MRNQEQTDTPAFSYKALYSLVRAGAAESMPVLEDLLLDQQKADDGINLRAFAVVAKARLRAEQSSHAAGPGEDRAAIKVRQLYQELGLTAESLNSAPVERFPFPVENVPGQFIASSAPMVRTEAGYAIRELADIVYQGEFGNYANLPEVRSVDFSRDDCSALKMRLAVYPRQERLGVIIQELARREVLKGESDYEIQLAINKGLPASRAAAAELREMDNHRERYNQVKHHAGFISLFRVIWGVGDAEQASLLEHFTNDKDGRVAHAARRFHRDVSRGTPHDLILLY